MARKITFMQAIAEALAQEMKRDPTVVVFGEDVVGGSGAAGVMDAWGGVMGVTKGIYDKHPNRILDTPISESAFIGAAVGAAASGLRPVAELMFVDFMGVCFDQIFNQGAKLRYMFGGKAKVPMVIRTMWGAGIRAASQHSQVLYPMEGDVPEESYAIPFGEASVVRDGDDVTIVAIGRMVGIAMAAAAELEGEAISCEIIDPRTTSPLDEETIYESVERTGRLVAVDESNPRCSLASDIAALVAQNCFASLRAAPRMVTAPHAPAPFAPRLEDAYVPGPERVAAAVREVI